MMGELFWEEVREGFPGKVASEQTYEKGRCGCAEIWGEWVLGGGNFRAQALRRGSAGSVQGAPGGQGVTCGCGWGRKREEGWRRRWLGSAGSPFEMMTVF